MRDNFMKLVPPLLGIEGGVADRPKKADPGGLTNKGITQKTYNAYRLAKGLEIQSVKLITNEEVIDIFKTQFWDTVRGDDLPNGVDWAVFDFSINSGPGRAVKSLQKVLNCTVDGIIGFSTMAAIEKADNSDLINRYCDERLRFMRGLKNYKYNPGWEPRVKGVREAALRMAVAPRMTKAVLPPVTPAGPAVATAKAVESNQAQLKTAKGSGFLLGGSGASGQTMLNYADQIKPHFGDTVIGRFAFAAFCCLLIIGGVLLGYSYLKDIHEKGGLSGFLASIFK